MRSRKFKALQLDWIIRSKINVEALWFFSTTFAFLFALRCEYNVMIKELPKDKETRCVGSVFLIVGRLVNPLADCAARGKATCVATTWGATGVICWRQQPLKRLHGASCIRRVLVVAPAIVPAVPLIMGAVNACVRHSALHHFHGIGCLILRPGVHHGRGHGTVTHTEYAFADLLSFVERAGLAQIVVTHTRAKVGAA